MLQCCIVTHTVDTGVSTALISFMHVIKTLRTLFLFLLENTVRTRKKIVHSFNMQTIKTYVLSKLIVFACTIITSNQSCRSRNVSAQFLTGCLIQLLLGSSCNSKLILLNCFYQNERATVIKGSVGNTFSQVQKFQYHYLIVHTL